MQNINQEKNIKPKTITSNNDSMNKNYSKRTFGKEVESRLIKVKKDRGDSDHVGNSKDKTNKKIDNLSTKFGTLNKNRVENIPNDETKRDKHLKDNFDDKKYDSKPKSALGLRAEIKKDGSKVYPEDTDAHEKNKPDRKKSSGKHRVPLIKTIRDSDDITKTYKAVTFTDEKSQKTLNIKIPNVIDVKKTKIPKLIDRTPRNHQNNIEAKPAEIKKIKKNDKFKHQREPSPIIICNQDGDSVPTEVAKWAPCSVNEETKPYYEAWVNTTLTARTRKDLLLEERDIIKNFQSSIDQRSYSPELMYEHLNDERFTGKIRINHR